MATVFRSCGWTLPGGIRVWVTSSSFCKTRTRVRESISPDETSGVFSSRASLGFRISRRMC